MKTNLQRIQQALAGFALGTCLAASAVEPAATAPKNGTRPADPNIQGEEIAVLTQAPNVPPPIKRKHATKVIVHLEVKEVVKKLADGVDYLFWTFGGDVPG